MRYAVGFIFVLALCFLSTAGCDDSNGDGRSCSNQDGGVTHCTSNRDGTELCALGNFWEPPELCAEGEVCFKPESTSDEEADAICVPGTGGTGGAAGSGGTAGTGGTAGSSCAELDIADLPELAGMLSLSPDSAAPDEFILVTADVDPDTKELTATILNESSGFPGGSCFVLTGGNETVECDLRVETVADPGSHVLELELRADPLNRVDYVLYTPGDGDTYVRIEFENNVPGPETATTCRQVNATIQF